ncbi:MAG: peptidoglycan editing factor PgeF [Myxococcota bacterium]
MHSLSEPRVEGTLCSPEFGGAQRFRELEHSVGLWRSSLLDRFGFRHGFALRTGGVSDAPYDTLNLGLGLGDCETAVLENRTRFAASLGLTTDHLFEQRQVHGTHVREVTAQDASGAVYKLEGDALITRVAGLGVAARTADCVPVLIAHPPTGDVAAVHAGWRGAVAGVVPRTIDALGRSPSELVVAVGPHIRVAAFEIGQDVAAQLQGAARATQVVDRSRPKPHGDLAALLRDQLHGAGIGDAAIDDIGGCTHSDGAHFFSHRRDHGETGRHLSAIVAGGAGVAS